MVKIYKALDYQRIDKELHIYIAVCFFTDPPSIQTHPHAVTVEEGENVTLFCNATGSSLTISWTFNGFFLPTSGDSRISFLTGNKQLIIKNVNRTDSGEYRCVASNMVGKDTSNAAIVSVECEYSTILAVLFMVCEQS